MAPVSGKLFSEKIFGHLNGIPMQYNGTSIDLSNITGTANNITTPYAVFVLPTDFRIIANEHYTYFYISALALTITSTILVFSAIASLTASLSSSSPGASRARALVMLLGASVLVGIAIPAHYSLGYHGWRTTTRAFGVPWWMLWDAEYTWGWDCGMAAICAITLLVMLAGLLCSRRPTARVAESTGEDGDKDDGANGS